MEKIVDKKQLEAITQKVQDEGTSKAENIEKIYNIIIKGNIQNGTSNSNANGVSNNIFTLTSRKESRGMDGSF